VRRIDFRRDDGVAMTEFALVLPVLVLVIAGILSFGRVFFYWIEANHLANETARWAVVDRNPYAPATLQQAARDASSKEFQQDVKVCIDFPAGAVVGNPVRVRVQKPFSLVPILNAGTITIRGSSEMRIERFANGTGPQNYAPGNLASGACS
jgi:Flp pilus assembly protein TadG